MVADEPYLPGYGWSRMRAFARGLGLALLRAGFGFALSRAGLGFAVLRAGLGFAVWRAGLGLGLRRAGLGSRSTLCIRLGLGLGHAHDPKP